MQEKDQDDKKLDALTKAMVTAIVRSPDMKRALEKALGGKALGDTAYMMMMVDLKRLAEFLHIDIPEVDDEPVMGGATFDDLPPLPDALGPSTDHDEAQRLSDKESAFRDFMAQRFDQAAWLKKNRIHFEP
jgi:hypothetical protein